MLIRYISYDKYYQIVYNISDTRFDTGIVGGGRNDLKVCGLSSDGNYLAATTSEKPYEIQLYKLCSDTRHYYDENTKDCMDCPSPMIECFGQGEYCLTCAEGYECSGYKCIKIISGCLNYTKDGIC